jgi:hypothetical protein
MAGSLIKIDEEIVTSAVASVDLGGANWDSSYDVYMVRINGLTCSTGIQTTNVRVLVSSSPDTTLNYDRAYKELKTNATFSNRSATNESGSRIFAQPRLALPENSNAIMYLFNFNSSAEYSFITFESVQSSGIGGNNSYQGGLVHTVAQSCNGIRIYQSSGTIDTGTFTLYGLKK